MWNSRYLLLRDQAGYIISNVSGVHILISRPVDQFSGGWSTDYIRRLWLGSLKIVVIIENILRFIEIIFVKVLFL